MPKYITTRIYAAMLESAASESASRRPRPRRCCAPSGRRRRAVADCRSRPRGARAAGAPPAGRGGRPTPAATPGATPRRLPGWAHPRSTTRTSSPVPSSSTPRGGASSGCATSRSG
ncbi:hypothetical protein [Blastococcus sp. TF02A-35]|uniref:hypothetical protein n=1 Tax=Blastococcus sp. TF02A-35 TaxID=2559612 RepID=UPI0032AF09B8